MFTHSRRCFGTIIQTPILLSQLRSISNRLKIQFFSSATTNFDCIGLKPEEEENILQYLNTCTIKELRSTDVFTNAQITELWKHRTTEGTFLTMTGFLSSLQMDVDALKPICSKLLSLSRMKINTSILKKYFAPDISLDQIKDFSTVTGMEVCDDSICFANLTNNMELMSWDDIAYPSFNYKKQQPVQVFEMAHSLVKKIPQSDVYLLEQHDFSSKRLSNRHFLQHLFLSQLQMSLLHLLNKDFVTSGQHKVFFARPYFVKKTFHLLVGGEGVSGQHLVTNLENDRILERLVMSPQQRHHFDHLKSGLQKERYTNALLLPLAFLQLRE